VRGDKRRVFVSTFAMEIQPHSDRLNRGPPFAEGLYRIGKWPSKRNLRTIRH
jgi:hypothetical protein